MNAMYQNIAVRVVDEQQNYFQHHVQDPMDFAYAEGNRVSQLNWEGIITTFAISAAGWTLIAMALNYLLS